MTEKKRDKEIRRYERQELALRLLPIALPVCVVALLVAAGLSVAALRTVNSVQDNADKIEKTTERLDRARVLLRESQIRGCEDRRFLRQATNALGSVVYRVLKAASSSNGQNARAYLKLLHDVAYAPLPNCILAVDHADKYVTPPPISFLQLDRLGRFNDQTGEITPRRGRKP